MLMMTVLHETRRFTRLLPKRITSTITTNANSSLIENFVPIPANAQSVQNVSEEKGDHDTIKQVNSSKQLTKENIIIQGSTSDSEGDVGNNNPKTLTTNLPNNKKKKKAGKQGLKKT